MTRLWAGYCYILPRQACTDSPSQKGFRARLSWAGFEPANESYCVPAPTVLYVSVKPIWVERETEAEKIVGRKISRFDRVLRKHVSIRGKNIKKTSLGREHDASKRLISLG